MRTFRVLTALCLAALASGCLSAFPPSSLDYGRGPAPLERGALRVQAGGGGGVAPMLLAGGGALGARAELQVSKNIAVGVDGGAGLQVMPLFLTVPFGAHVSTQVNPGLDWLALRASVGVGTDVSSVGTVALPLAFPWFSAAGSLVLGLPPSWFEDSALDPYLSLNLGARRYVGVVTPSSRSLQTTAIYNSVYAGGATVGAAWKVTDIVSFYGALNGTLVIVEQLDMISSGNPVGISPVLSAQGGIAFTF